MSPFDVKPGDWTPAMSDANYRRNMRIIWVATLLTLVNAALLVARLVWP